METISWKITDITGTPFCVTSEQGDSVREEFEKYLQSGNKVSISFEEIRLVTSAFLNTAIGALYQDLSVADVSEHLSVENITPNDRVILKCVLDTAKQYYTDPEKFNREYQLAMES